MARDEVRIAFVGCGNLANQVQYADAVKTMELVERIYHSQM